ncbi:hypothetical protein [Flavobacterium sp.]|uniref:hypothetical protein n=1 Tax=Flavobacterium sp. TaxID=239 RepID=UPI00286E54DF|nr:hypothetical protein [Flavobacterium sp.]
MKKVILLLSVCFFISCYEKKKSEEKKIETTLIQSVDQKSIESFLTDEKANSSPILLGWINYYKEFLSKDFAIKNFIFDEEIKLTRLKGTVYGSFDKNFDKIYEPFLIYSPQKTQYIDIDSNTWQVEDSEMKNVTFNPDQVINLVDLKSKKIEKIMFVGPSQWVEDAFWINEESLILLGNDTDFNPKVMIVDFISNKFKVYKYKINLKEPSEYSDERLRLKGLNVSGE